MAIFADCAKLRVVSDFITFAEIGRSVRICYQVEMRLNISIIRKKESVGLPGSGGFQILQTLPFFINPPYSVRA